MDWTVAVVALLGLTGTMVAPYVAYRLGRAQRREQREDRLREQLRSAYVKFLPTCEQWLRNAKYMAAGVPAEDDRVDTMRSMRSAATGVLLLERDAFRSRMVEQVTSNLESSRLAEEVQRRGQILEQLKTSVRDYLHYLPAPEQTAALSPAPDQ